MQRKNDRKTMGNHLWAIRRYKEGDEEKILKLRKLCFGSADLDKWIWEYKNSPFGNIMMVAEHQGQIIAFYSRLSVKMKVGDKILKGSIASDAMVHPDFRRKGLWHRLFKTTWERAKKEGQAISYSFANKTTYKYRPKEAYAICRFPVLVKFFDTYEEMEKRVRNQFLAKILSVSANALFRVFCRAKKCPPVENVTVSEITEFDDRINRFWKEASSAFKIAVVRNKEYLNWRYFQRPNSDFTVLLAEEGKKLLGYIVFSVQKTLHRNRGYVIDIITHPDRPEIIQFLISKAIDRLKKEKVSLIVCSMMKNNPYYKVFRENGFVRHSGSHILALADPSKVSEMFVKDPKNWYLTLGDSDGIGL